MSRLVTRAPAKVNLSLHILGRREGDGYHELESLVAFTGWGDTLTLDPASDLALTTSGPTAGPAGPLDDNLVIRAARHLASAVPSLRWGHFHLVKRLPVAAGIGGGSSDAAAALRLLARLNDLPITHPDITEAARRTGADVPVCLEPSARMMCGAGESVGAALGLPPLAALLINPGVAVSTAPVFRALGLAVGAKHSGLAHADMTSCAGSDALIAALERGRNDLEAPALTVAPVIGAVLNMLREQPGCRLARMSGSGATVFGLFSDRTAVIRAGRRIRLAEAGWWMKPVLLR